MGGAVVLVDAEAFVSAWLRSQPAIVALDVAVVTVLPTVKTFPIVRVTRIGGAPAQFGDPVLWADVPALQVEAYATRKAQAWSILLRVQAELAGMVGVHPTAEVLGVSFGASRYVPDETFTPAQPRAVLSVDMTIKPVSNGGQ